MTLLIYLIKTVFISGLLFGYYSLFLRNRRFHGFNRLFMLSIPVISLLLPLFSFNLPVFWNHASAGSPIRLLGVGGGKFEEVVTIYANSGSHSVFTWVQIAGICSGLISVLLFIRFYNTIRFLHRLGKNNRSVRLPEATVFFVDEKGTPFSFFRNIYWGEEMDIDSTAGRQILRHEIYHVVNNHSLDILVNEIISILCWFNPFFYLTGRELRAIHEYAADAYAADGADQFEYANLLLMKESGSAVSLAHPFFKNQIKRRILMITKSPKNKKALLSRLMILPLILVLVGVFSFKIQNQFHVLKTKTFRVVIDAGHGGSFNGTAFNGQMEKNINLLIAKKIQSLSGQYNVDVIMSRETDVTPGSNELHESLEWIAALSKNKNADLFISIHTNATETAQEGKQQTDKSGFQIWIPRSSSEVYVKSLKLGSVLTESIKPDYTIEPELKQPPGDGGNILILRKATVPAVLIECGYLDNPNDLKYLLDEKNQERIARDILEGIKKYNADNTSFSGSSDFEDPLAGAVWISEEQSSHIADEKLQRLELDTKLGLIIYYMKDGKKYFSNMPDWYKKFSDSVNQSKSENVTKNVSLTENKSVKLAVTNNIIRNEKVSDSTGPLKKVEVEATYPGGSDAWRQYILNNLKYPEEAVKNEIQGEVVVEFVVNKDGSLTGVHAISGPDRLKAESVRVVTKSGKWVPALEQGKKVASTVKQPINYRLKES